MAVGEAWTAAENEVIATAYLSMLEAELRRQPFVKARVNAEVQERTGRGRGSVEYKFQNVSAVLRDLSHPFINGYKPASNYQESLVEAVAGALGRMPSVAEAAFEAVTRPFADVDVRVDLHWSDAPVVDIGNMPSAYRRAVKRDYVRLDAENHRLGLAGERAVVQLERRNLATVGRADLALRVEHVSQTQGDGLGFDILSFTPAGGEKLIEVKTTRQGIYWPMLVTRNELQLSRDEAERFHLYRVFDFDRAKPGVFTLSGSIRSSCALTAAVYEARPIRAPS